MIMTIIYLTNLNLPILIIFMYKNICVIMTIMHSLIINHEQRILDYLA